jgi:hypothetical protein
MTKVMKPKGFQSKTQKVLMVELSGQLGSLTQELVEDFIATNPGFGNTLCLQGVSDSLDGHGGRVDRIMDPPSSIVVPEVMV